MSRTIQQLLTLEVPVIVRVGSTRMALAEVISLSPGSIIEMGKHAEEELDLLINNRHVGFGVAVKIGENFGVEITYLGDPVARGTAAEGATIAQQELAAMADEMLAGLQ